MRKKNHSKNLKIAKYMALQRWLLKLHFRPSQHFYKAKKGVFVDKMAVKLTPYIELQRNFQGRSSTP